MTSRRRSSSTSHVNSPSLSPLAGAGSGKVGGVLMEMTFLLSLTFPLVGLWMRNDLLSMLYPQRRSSLASGSSLRVCVSTWTNALAPIAEGVRGLRPCNTEPCTAWCFLALHVEPCCSGIPLSASVPPTGS